MDKTTAEVVIEMLQDSLVLDEVTTAMKLRDDLGMDSLDIVDLEIWVSDHYRKDIDLGGALTVQDAINICEEAAKS